MKEKLMTHLSSVTQRVEAAWLPRYQQLDNREQRLVLIAALLLPILIIIFGLMWPLKDRQDVLRTNLAAVEKRAVEAEQLAQYLIRHPHTGQSAGVTDHLLTTVEQLARKTGVRQYMTRIKPQASPDGSEQRLMISMKDAPYDATLRWVHALAGAHAGLKRLKIQAADVPGHIHVLVILTNR